MKIIEVSVSMSLKLGDKDSQNETNEVEWKLKKDNKELRNVLKQR